MSKKRKEKNILKASKYNIIFEHDGKILAFNSFTTSLAEVDSDFLRLLENIEKSDVDNLNEKDTELLEQMKRGNFVIDDEVNELDLLKVSSFTSKCRNQHFAFTVALTLQCNFDCPYCYQNRQVGKISKDVREAIYKRIESEAALKHDISITWYGGEPLLAKDILEEMANKIIDICDKAGVRYSSSMITNGYLVDKDTIELLKRIKIKSVQVTIDGPPDIHNARRRTFDHSVKTFDKIIENIKLLCDNDISVNIRVNIDKGNKNELERLLKILAENGLQKCSISLGQVKDYTAACSSIAHTCLSGKEYADESLKDQEMLLKYGFSAKSFPYYPGIKSNYCCADAISSYVVDPEGNLYKCWNDTGVVERSVGNIKDDKIKYNKIYLDYLLWSPFDYEKCRECKCLPLCMGGCPYEGLKLGKPECEKWIYNLKEVLKMRYDINCAEEQKATQNGATS